MKYLLLAVILLLAIAAFCLAYAADRRTTPFEWLPVIGISSPEVSFYYDRTSIQSNKEQDSRYRSTILLIVYNNPRTIQTDQGSKQILSMVRLVMADCEDKLAMPLNDFFFGIALPTLQTVPIAQKRYEATAEEMFSINKSSPMHNVLCPTFI